MVEMKTVIPKIDEESGVAWLTLNRPEKKNAMSRGLMAEMIALLKELRDNDKIRCIVTTGAGQFLFLRTRSLRSAGELEAQKKMGRRRINV